MHFAAMGIGPCRCLGRVGMARQRGGARPDVLAAGLRCDGGGTAMARCRGCGHGLAVDYQSEFFVGNNGHAQGLAHLVCHFLGVGWRGFGLFFDNFFSRCLVGVRSVCIRGPRGTASQRQAHRAQQCAQAALRAHTGIKRGMHGGQSLSKRALFQTHLATVGVYRRGIGTLGRGLEPKKLRWSVD